MKENKGKPSSELSKVKRDHRGPKVSHRKRYDRVVQPHDNSSFWFVANADIKVTFGANNGKKSHNS
jgi:hypothetical protein